MMPVFSALSVADKLGQKSNASVIALGFAFASICAVK